jgi:hypothetical protein
MVATTVAAKLETLPSVAMPQRRSCRSTLVKTKKRLHYALGYREEQIYGAPNRPQGWRKRYLEYINSVGCIVGCARGDDTGSAVREKNMRRILS